ncbi:hypothetical protein [Spirochaeta cellobiosiphila]|uniref:hypothetical protein n=1 Tax=Spirochaeta cellobiosiphila TaxID=504483 RepID=UPI000402A2DC|nr:hypothetical protein [Spirochaeta cellobiosiphila]
MEIDFYNTLFSIYFGQLWAYNLFVDTTFDDIIEAAESKGETVRVVGGDEATAENLTNNELTNDDTQRLIVVAHGGSSGSFYDTNDDPIDLSSFDLSNTGSIMTTIDLVGCYASTGSGYWETQTGLSDIRTYNPSSPSSPIHWNQTNDTLQDLIPESIETGVDNSGEPINKPYMIYI